MVSGKLKPPNEVTMVSDQPKPLDTMMNWLKVAHKKTHDVSPSVDIEENIDEDCQTSRFDNKKQNAKWEITIYRWKLRQTKPQMGDNKNKSVAKISSLVINCQYGHFKDFSTCHIFI